MAKSPHDTPAMRQFRRFKQQHPDCVLFFRMGDFYELFYDDAKLVARVLGLTLTQRTEGIPMAGVPYHSVENYLRRMIQAGHRVAICEQMEDPAEAKGVVDRDVTRVVTPGTLTDESMLDDAEENPLAAVMFAGDERAAVAFAELSTGAFRVAEFTAEELRDELARIAPRELLYVETANNVPPPRIKQIGDALGIALTPRPSWHFRLDDARDTLLRQFQVATLSGFGFDEDDPVIGPAGAVVAYLLETQRAENGRLRHLMPPRRYQQADHLVIDHVSLRSLEVERTMRSGETAGSLLGALQDARTAMGKRLLRQWLCYPLRDADAIRARQDVVQAVVDDADLSDDLLKRLDTVQDVHRIASRIAIGRPSPRDLVALGQSVAAVKQLAVLLETHESLAGHHRQLTDIAPELEALAGRLREACVDEPPPHMREGGLIRDGFDEQLDGYRALQRDSHSWLADYQKRITSESGIPSLKVGYNKVFGYYIEVTHTHSDKVPDSFTRKQTLKNAERYITPELKDYENKVLSAEQKAIAREQALFDTLCKAASDRLAQLHEYATVVAELDVLACFARRAKRRRYVRPAIVDEPALHIDEGRHPVLDELLADQFVPNDVDLGRQEATEARRREGPEGESDDGEDQRRTDEETGSPGGAAVAGGGRTLALITGPNMSGKSTYIRQTALLVLMAHTGSFVPASRATVGLTDRIFTRIGASDELHMGQSTFMVEMVETANICHHATERSLVILDEIGRGTSTLDGLALAWAIAEHLAGRRCRALFATHYHELTQLGQKYDNVVNLNVAVREWAEEVVFLHRIVPGGTDRSYGIHVAKIAGLPGPVIDRARQLMGQLEVNTEKLRPAEDGAVDAPKLKAAAPQMSLFTEYVEHPAMARLREMDLNALSPIDAFDLLRQLKSELGDETQA